MLLVETRTAEKFVEGPMRTALLEALQGLGYVPVIRSARLGAFEQALGGGEHAKELERALAAWADEEGDAPYVRGDIFCSEGHAHFIVFGEEEDTGGAALRAGLVYTAETGDPAGKLEAFCRGVEQALGGALEWRGLGGEVPETFARLKAEAGVGESASLPAARGGDAAERMRAAELLEDVVARDFLHRLSRAHAAGLAADMVVSGGHDAARNALVARLAGAGLVRREVQVSCRQSGRSIFRLPSTEALAIVTASNAVCSDCGGLVADEDAKEVATPTPLADSMLKGGAWLVNSMKGVLAEIGIPEGEVVAWRPGGDDEARLLANVSGEPFLFFVRDGDFAASDARHALEAEAETHATRLAVVSTGKIQDEARARLREHARRRSRTGGPSEVVFVEGLEAAPVELRRAVERVSREALTRELFELDQSAGFNVGLMLAESFRLTRTKEALPDVAASAAGALAGSLQEL